MKHGRETFYKMKSKDQEIYIREAKPEDTDGILNVIRESFIATYPNSKNGIMTRDVEKMIEPAFTEDSIALRKDSIENPKGSITVVAEFQQRIVGFCALSLKPEMNQMQSIYILPEHTGRGIGTLMWEFALSKLSGREKPTIVHVATYNKKAIAFYMKLGFKDNGRRFTEARHMSIPEMEMIRE